VRAALLVLVLVAPLATAYPVDVEDDALARAASWLRDRTRDDGCIAAAPEGSCGVSSTHDAVLALSGAGHDPNTWRTGTGSPVDYLRAARAQIDQLPGACPACHWAKAVVALAASGQDPRTFGDYDYVARLDQYYDGVQVGSANQVNDDAWALYAYAATDEPHPGKVENIRLFLQTRQNPSDGGWSWNLGAKSEPWGTATVLLALLATGTDPNTSSVARALDYLRSQQGPNGLILQDGADSAESTAITVQAIVAARRDPQTWVQNGRTLATALLALQAEDGSFAHNAGGGSRFLATTQTLPALRGVPYPFRPPTVAIAVSPSIGNVDTTFKLHALAADSDGTVTTHRWRSSDGWSAEGERVERSFPTPGTHRVRVIVIDDDGVARGLDAHVRVEPRGALVPPSLSTTLIVTANHSWTPATGTEAPPLNPPPQPLPAPTAAATLLVFALLLAGRPGSRSGAR
jgi:hypothetical protein